ncbi:hypothetical protein P3339_07385 [Microbulbifer sp. MLAF003]|uniref:hypothetical protein n=1 Tax=Microbulbifer sp. MLAF003 TaxID=3032582 RepID=UPI0024AE2102|nr:hypothetical protein [Microbulbifer sp. MLAF003]WHI52580.1 hypothetical protein P3339_07385 [Microbulbifer sp. MLAF003]
MLSAGLDDYLSKPVSEAQLSHMIKRWLKLITPQVVEKLNFNKMRLVDIGESMTLANGDAKLARDMLQMLVDGLASDERELERLQVIGDFKSMFELTHRMHGGAVIAAFPGCAKPPVFCRKSCAHKKMMSRQGLIVVSWMLY